MNEEAPMPIEPQHFAGLEEARTIKTEQFLLTQMLVDHCARRHSLGVVIGRAGRGKTFAVNSALADASVPVIKTLFGSQTTRREVARQFVEKGTNTKASGTYYTLSEDCVEIFREPHLAVIDEAQHLNQDCTFFLRYLIDHPETRVGIVLIGAGGCWAKIKADETLRSRVFRRIEFEPIPRKQLLAALPRYHKLFHNVDAELLEELERSYALAEHRALARFTVTAWDLCEGLGRDRLDEDVMKRSLALIGDA